jgi:hypothetical protein
MVLRYPGFSLDIEASADASITNGASLLAILRRSCRKRGMKMIDYILAIIVAVTVFGLIAAISISIL